MGHTAVLFRPGERVRLQLLDAKYCGSTQWSAHHSPHLETLQLLGQVGQVSSSRIKLFKSPRICSAAHPRWFRNLGTGEKLSEAQRLEAGTATGQHRGHTDHPTKLENHRQSEGQAQQVRIVLSETGLCRTGQRPEKRRSYFTLKNHHHDISIHYNMNVMRTRDMSI